MTRNAPGRTRLGIRPVRKNPSGREGLQTDTYDAPCSFSGRTRMPPTSNPSEPEFLKVEEVAARLKVKDKTVRDWIARGELEAYKIGKEWRIRRDHFDEAIEARRVGAQAAPSGGLWDPDAP